MPWQPLSKPSSLSDPSPGLSPRGFTGVTSTLVDMAARLADAVRKRRAELSLNLIQIRDRGGPRAPIMVKIEHGDTEVLDPDTLAALDRALDWTVGSAATVLDGGSPTAREVAEVQFVTSGITVSHGEVSALTAAAFRLQELAAARPSDAELVEAVEGLAQSVAPMYGQFITELLAANAHGVGSDAVVEAIVPLLVERDGAALDEGAALRRWLAGLGGKGERSENA